MLRYGKQSGGLVRPLTGDPLNWEPLQKMEPLHSDPDPASRLEQVIWLAFREQRPGQVQSVSAG